MQKIILISVLLSAFVTACSVSRKSGTKEYPLEKGVRNEYTVESIVENNISNQNFYIQKADIKVVQNSISVRFTASIRFRLPDSLLITVRSKTGIEAGRAFITKDTILINDRINKKLLIGNPEMIELKYGIEPSLIYAILGDVIVDEKERKKSYSCSQGLYRSDFEYNNKMIEYTVDCNKMKAVRAYFEGDIKTGNITISFSDIVNLKQLKFPQRIEINDDLNSVSILIEIKKIESPWNGRIGFVSGAGYKVIKIR